MKAMIYTEYGGPEVFHPAELEKPTPQDDEILIRVLAVSVGYGDLLARRMNEVGPREFNMPAPLWIPTRLIIGLRKPRFQVLGAEIAGVVEAVGAAVTAFQPGDAVMAYPGQHFGGNAEYICMKASGPVAHQPANMSPVEAASLPYGGLTAYNLLKNRGIQPGQKVLINGASGSIGSFAMQLAKHYGAEVTGVAGTARQEMLRQLGADHTIDYTQQDFTQNGEKYDLIMDVLGRTTFGRVKNSLTENGVYLRASFKLRELFQMLINPLRGGRKVLCVMSTDESQAVMQAVKELAEQGVLKTVIDQTYPLEQLAEAHRRAEGRERTGHVVVTLDHLA